MSWEKLRGDVREIWQAGVDAVAPLRLLQNVMSTTPQGVLICGSEYRWSEWERLIVVGAGKAGGGMAAAVEAILGERIVEERVTGWVNVPEDCVRPLQKIHLHGARPAGVNEPTEEGVRGTERILELVQSAGERDLCLVLISGGGSALLPLPVSGVSLAAKQQVTRLLMQRGATIGELNCVRKQLSRVKGGGLARSSRARRMVSLILSDVIGDPLDVIASGPTVPDSSTPGEALKVLRRFEAGDQNFPREVIDYLIKRETENEPQDFPHERVENHVIGNNRTALEAAGEAATQRGYEVRSLGSDRSGKAEEEGREFARQCREIQGELRATGHPVCLLSGGEPTVKLTPTDKPRKGGRNQQLILSVLDEFWDTGLEGMALLSGGTDGEDGPTDAAGGFVDAEVWRLAHASERSLKEGLQIQNAYPYLRSVGGLLVTGPTHTNVMDLRVGVIHPCQNGQ